MAASTAYPPTSPVFATAHLTDDEPTPQKISAYYSLIFPTFTYYIQTLNVTIGRRCIPSGAASSSENPQVDVDLGPLKSVSRLHAKIEYEEEEERFVLAVIGRNGAWVDGVWSGSGSKVPLGERSQIQIASRTFHFVLPPPPAPEDSPSPSSYSSNENRARSPSVDIVDVTSISPPSSVPSYSPPPTAVAPAAPKIPPRVDTQLPNSNSIKPKTNPKKRKKDEAQSPPPPPPDILPPKPQLTYAQLCYRAIKALGGKGSLQDICQWIKEAHEWYKYCGKDWESSVRHNLSSNPGFKKLLRAKEEKGKGALWMIDEAHEHTFEELDAKREAAAALQAAGVSGKKKSVIPLEPPFKRSIRGDTKGTPLPPPLTTAPLALKTNAIVSPPIPPSISPPTSLPAAPAVKLETPTPQLPSLGLYSASATPNPSATVSSIAGPSSEPAPAPASAFPAIPASVRIPIVIGSALAPDAPPAKPIVLQDNTLILNPDIFAHLAPEHLKDLEALGAQKALEILQSYIVRYYKEKLRAEGGRARGRGKPKRGRTPGRGALPGGPVRADAPAGPFTVAPLPLHASTAPEALPAAASSAAPSSTAPAAAEEDREASPVVIIDDDPVDEGPAPKRRRLDGAAAVSV